MVPELVNTLEECIKIHKSKNEDYSGGHPDSLINFHQAQVIMSMFGREEDKGFAYMIGIKLARIAALRNSGKTPSNESILDSFNDLINYSALWKADIQRS